MFVLLSSLSSITPDLLSRWISHLWCGYVLVASKQRLKRFHDIKLPLMKISIIRTCCIWKKKLSWISHSMTKLQVIAISSSTCLHYRKICLFHVPTRYRGSTHGIKTYAVSQQVQPTAKQTLTAYLTVAHGESRAHDRLRQKLTAKHGTRQNKLKAHGRVEPTANCWSGPTFEAGLTARPDGRHLPCALQSRTVNRWVCNFPPSWQILPRKFKIIAAQIFKIWNMSVPTICRELSRKAHGIDTFCRVLWWPAHGKPFISAYFSYYFCTFIAPTIHILVYFYPYIIGPHVSFWGIFGASRAFPPWNTGLRAHRHAAVRAH
jgi:hypothetical protein